MNPTLNSTCFILGGTVLPLVSTIIGLILWKKPPGINSVFGFRTKLSKNSENEWRYAQTYSGKLMTIFSAPMTAISAAVCIYSSAARLDNDKKFLTIAVLVITEIIIIAAVNILTDHKLKLRCNNNSVEDDNE